MTYVHCALLRCRVYSQNNCSVRMLSALACTIKYYVVFRHNSHPLRLRHIWTSYIHPYCLDTRSQKLPSTAHILFMDICLNQKKMYFREKGQERLLGDFNVRVGSGKYWWLFGCRLLPPPLQDSHRWIRSSHLWRVNFDFEKNLGWISMSCAVNTSNCTHEWNHVLASNPLELHS